MILRMRRALMVLVAAFVWAAVAAGAAGAVEVKGVRLADSVQAGGATLALNGAGVRTKLFIKVYVGALYAVTPGSDAAKLIAADEPKRIVMHFLYGVDKDKINEAWREGFAANSASRMPALGERLERLCALFTETMREGNEIVLTYLPGKGTEVAVNGSVRGVIEGADFMQALWGVWLGEKPADAGLRKGMLGQK